MAVWFRVRVGLVRTQPDSKAPKYRKMIRKMGWGGWFGVWRMTSGTQAGSKVMVKLQSIKNDGMGKDEASKSGDCTRRSHSYCARIGKKDGGFAIMKSSTKVQAQDNAMSIS